MSRWDRRLALAAGSLGLVLLIIAVGQLVVDGGITPGLAYSLVGGVALLVVSAVVDPKALGELARDRRARFGSLSVLVSAGLVGVLVMVNLIASRSLVAADLTRAGYYTLSGQTVAVLERLDSTLTITGFYRFTPAETAERHNQETLLALYQAKSPRVVVHMVDPDLNFSLAKRLGVTISASLALEYKSKTPVVLTLGSQTEQDITSAILKLESNRTPQICWATGDGERDLKSTDEVGGYSAAAAQLGTNNFKVVEIPLATIPAIPNDCDALAVVGPGRALSGAGPQLVADYLARGGKLLIATDPLQPSVTASMNGVLKPYGVAFDGGLVIDADSNHQAANDVTTPVALDYGASPIAKDMRSRFTYFPQPTAITGTPDASIASVQLVTTTGNSYEIVADRAHVGRQAGDKPGPFVLMETLEQKQDQGKLTRVAVVGTAGIAENETLPPNDRSGGSNLQLFLGTMNWLTQQEDLISVPPKPARSVPIPVTDADKTFNVLVTAVLLPLLVAGIGFYIWLVRRRRA